MFKNLVIELNGLARALVMSLVLSVGTAVVVYFTGLAETVFPTVGKIVIISSIFVGACYISRLRGSRGLLRGINFGLIFFILMLITTLAFDPSLVQMKSFFYTLLLCLASGALGGVLGIGLSE